MVNLQSAYGPWGPGVRARHAPDLWMTPLLRPDNCRVLRGGSTKKKGGLLAE